jgi:hypothetical protein
VSDTKGRLVVGWREYDGQFRLHAKITKELEEDGMSHSEAHSTATKELLNLRGKDPGVYEIHAGRTVFKVTVKE